MNALNLLATNWDNLVKKHGPTMAKKIVLASLQTSTDYARVLNPSEFGCYDTPLMEEVFEKSIVHSVELKEQLTCMGLLLPLMHPHWVPGGAMAVTERFLSRALGMIDSAEKFELFLDKIAEHGIHVSGALQSKDIGRALTETMGRFPITHDSLMTKLRGKGWHNRKSLVKGALAHVQSVQQYTDLAEFGCSAECITGALSLATTREEYGQLAGIGCENKFTERERSRAFDGFLRLSTTPEEVRDVLRGENTKNLPERLIWDAKLSKICQRYTAGLTTIEACLAEFNGLDGHHACTGIVRHALTERVLELCRNFSDCTKVFHAFHQPVDGGMDMDEMIGQLIEDGASQKSLSEEHEAQLLDLLVMLASNNSELDWVVSVIKDRAHTLHMVSIRRDQLAL